MNWIIGVVYFLFKDKKIIYIGKTTRLEKRLAQHRCQYLEWDEVKTKQYPIEKLNEMEAIWIQYFKPELNCVHKHSPKIKIKEKITSKKYSTMVFRKLTRKSLIGFGKAHDRSVEELLKINKTLELVDIYFKCSHITFFDDILDQLKITPEWRIEKPGKDKEKFAEFCKVVYPEREENREINFRKFIKIKAKQTLKHIEIANKTKSYHRSFNQKP